MLACKATVENVLGSRLHMLLLYLPICPCLFSFHHRHMT